MTDSTASLPAGAAERWGIEVVALEVGLGDVRFREGVDLDPAELLAALGGGTAVTTSQPPPAAFAEAYANAAARGAREVVSVHLSEELSGTVGAARLAAATAPVPVHVVDSRTVAMGLGFAVLAAAEMAREGAGAEDHVRSSTTAPGQAAAAGAGVAAVAGGGAVADRARAVAVSSWVLFLVDGLEHLRRGGRIGGTAAAVGGLLGMRPLLTTRDGRVEVAGAVRTRRAGHERLASLAVAEATARPRARIAVHHLGRREAAEDLADVVRTRLREGATAGSVPRPGGPAGAVPQVVVADVSAVVGAHTGPGVLGVVVADG